jgi:hypothetical protein
VSAAVQPDAVSLVADLPAARPDPCAIIRGGASASVRRWPSHRTLDDIENHAARGFSETSVGLQGRLGADVFFAFIFEVLARTFARRTGARRPDPTQARRQARITRG